MIGQPKTVSWVIVSCIGLRGVFQYCVTRYLIVWPFLGALPFSTVLQSECKRSRSRKARQSFHNLLKIVFHTWLVYYQVPLMIGEIPISDACHYMDAHDMETVYQTQRGWEQCCSNRWVCDDESNWRWLVYGRGSPRRASDWSWESHNGWSYDLSKGR